VLIGCLKMPDAVFLKSCSMVTAGQPAIDALLGMSTTPSAMSLTMNLLVHANFRQSWPSIVWIRLSGTVIFVDPCWMTQACDTFTDAMAVVVVELDSYIQVDAET
jgi:hypothetical protein